MIVASKYFDGWSVDCDGGYYTRNGVDHHGCKNRHTGYHYFKCTGAFGQSSTGVGR